MTDYADISTFSDVQTALAGNGNITTAEITEMKDGRDFMKPTQYYSIDMGPFPRTPEGIGNTSGEINNLIIVYIRGTTEANLIQRMSWIEDTWNAQSATNKFFDSTDQQRLGIYGKFYHGTMILIETIFNVESGYTT
jgi:hypothetical protein